MNDSAVVRVWDPVVRIFHWTLAVAFVVSYISAGEPLWLHAGSGYLVLALLVVRVVWGFVGTYHARFATFVHGPVAAFRYLVAEIGGRARRYIGHNPAGAVMIVALLVGFAAQVALGLSLLAADEAMGPFAGWISASEKLEERLGEIHEVMANVLLGLIVVHVLGVALGSLRHREDLVGAMVHGYKPRADR